MSFDECAKACIEAHEAGWKNAKHRQQWTNTLKTYVSPVFGRLPVQAVDTSVVLKVLEPIWAKRTETATRVRQRIEAVLDWAKVRELRAGDNPARWRGHLDKMLPKPGQVRKVQHHPALPYTQIGEFMSDLRKRGGIAARALEFVILCAVRTGDVIGNDRDDKPPMRRSHVDKDGVWTIPSTKNSTQHRVPLSATAQALLVHMEPVSEDAPVFSGIRAGEPISNMSMAAVIERMNDDRTACGLARYADPHQSNRDVTVHGFRSSFRDWAAECTAFPRELAEKSLAHSVGDETERAYQRGDLLERRRKPHGGMGCILRYVKEPRSSNKEGECRTARNFDLQPLGEPGSPARRTANTEIAVSPRMTRPKGDLTKLRITGSGCPSFQTLDRESPPPLESSAFPDQSFLLADCGLFTRFTNDRDPWI